MVAEYIAVCSRTFRGPFPPLFKFLGVIAPLSNVAHEQIIFGNIQDHIFLVTDKIIFW